MATTQLCPTDRWLGAVSDVMPALTGPAGTAERLLMLLHYGIDWSDGWVSRYRASYWDQLLPDRVVVSTYRASNLRRWWADVAGELGASPRDRAQRAELEALLREPPGPVLEALRLETAPLLLRVRIVAEANREARTKAAS